MAQGAGRRNRDDDNDGIDFGEEGLDIDTYEANYRSKATSYMDDEEEDDGQGAAKGGPLGDSRPSGKHDASM